MKAILDAIFPIPAQTFVGILVAFLMVHVILVSITICIYLERKLSAWIQDRIGPNRTGFDFGLPVLQKLFRKFGFWGLGQALADGLKFFLKEDYMPRGADKWLFTIAPMAAAVPAFIGWAVLPWGGTWDFGGIDFSGREWVTAGQVVFAAAEVNVGFIYILAVASLSIYGITLGGWASNNKYSFLGGLRSSAAMISYEIPLGLALMATLLFVGTLMPSEIVRAQAQGMWLVFAQPLAAIVFFTCIMAEANRAPFDNAEAEQELVGGYHTEYSAMRFALFFLAEYAHMIASSALFVMLFLGGYHLPGLALTSPDATGLLAVIVKVIVFFTKAMASVCFMMLVRWTIPRIRFDQVMKLCWQVLIPLGIILVVGTSIMVFFGLTEWWKLLGMNIVVLAGVLAVAPVVFNKGDLNRKIPMAGSRFSPLEGYEGGPGPSDPIALEDDNPFRTAGARAPA
jgi:NADH-quinone oxidoreductase subunit H